MASSIRRIKRRVVSHVRHGNGSGAAPDTLRRRLNQYTCDTCGGTITTVDLHEGVTPMFLNCRATEGCAGRMVSRIYRVEGEPEPQFEWYKPDKPKKSDREYVELGGLLIRPVTT